MHFFVVANTQFLHVSLTISPPLGEDFPPIRLAARYTGWRAGDGQLIDSWEPNYRCVASLKEPDAEDSILFFH